MRQRLTLCLLQLEQTHLYEGLASFVGLSWVFRGSFVGLPTSSLWPARLQLTVTLARC
jgi:hypothetical protein